MRNDKDIAFNLRKEGKSYRQIEAELGISRSTLCEWFRNEEWSLHAKNENNRKNTLLSTQRIQKLNEGRKKKLNTLYADIEARAGKDFGIFKKDPLFMAGLMIYAGEGDKVARHVVRISNSELYLHRIFIDFACKYLPIEKGSIRFGIIAYSDNDIELCEQYWSEGLGIERKHFHKTQIIVGKETRRKLQNGVGMSIISSTGLKKRVSKWLELCAQNAGMV